MCIRDRLSAKIPDGKTDIDKRVADAIFRSGNLEAFSGRSAVYALSLIHIFTVSEVKQVGYATGLPAELVDKVPSDGLCGQTDEDHLGFTYEVLDRYIRTGKIEDPATKEKIDRLHEKNLFKLQLMPCFSYQAWLKEQGEGSVQN